MKILVLQLARLGDIYQTWPTLKALKRSGAEVHLLTREKFSAAAPGFGVIDKHWLLSTREVLAPLIEEKPIVDLSLDRLEAFCAEVKAEKYDRVVNLSFSPFSSYLTREVAGHAEIAGYTRFEDGYLQIPDDGSAYFYAQVGVGRPNRLHMTDLFAYVAGVELNEGDWSVSEFFTDSSGAGDDTVLIHVGASQSGKTLSSHKWQQVAKKICQSDWPGQIVLVGAKEEMELAMSIAAVSGERKPVNLVGLTQLDELFAMVNESCLLIGGDSGPMQMASLTDTPALNVSFPMVSFWETGPRSKGSRILCVQSEEDVSAEEIASEALSMLRNQAPRLPVVRVPGQLFPFVEMRPAPLAFEWEMVRALYMGEGFPKPPNELFMLAIERLDDVNSLALEQIHALRAHPSHPTATAILDEVDGIMDQIVKMVPETSPLIRWFRTERTRIGPMPVQGLIDATATVHSRLGDVIGIYREAKESARDDVNLG